MDYNINNLPKYATDYEFIIATENNNEFWFFGAYENGFEADRIASQIDGIIFHNVRIQGKNK